MNLLKIHFFQAFSFSCLIDPNIILHTVFSNINIFSSLRTRDEVSDSYNKTDEVNSFVFLIYTSFIGHGKAEDFEADGSTLSSNFLSINISKGVIVPKLILDRIIPEDLTRTSWRRQSFVSYIDEGPICAAYCCGTMKLKLRIYIVHTLAYLEASRFIIE
jgi:hypothetical protein